MGKFVLKNILFFSLFIFFSCTLEDDLSNDLISRSLGLVTVTTADNGDIFTTGDTINFNLSYNSKVTNFNHFVVKLVNKNDKSIINQYSYSIENFIITEILPKENESEVVKNKLNFKTTNTTKNTSKSQDYRDEFFSNLNQSENDEENIDEKVDINIKNLPCSFLVPEIKLDEYYALQFDFFDDKKLIGNGEINFFTSSVDYIIDNLVSYPIIVYPNGEALLSANLPNSNTFDTELRWYANDEIIFKSKLSDAPKYIVFKAPEAQSVMKITVGIYPQFAPKNEVYDFMPPIKSTTNIFISENQTIEKSDFIDNGNYNLLMHFKGELKDFSEFKRPIEITNKPKLSIEEGIFGYNFNESSLKVNDIPFISENNKIEPFTVRVKALFNMENTGKIATAYIGNKVFFELKKSLDYLTLDFNLGEEKKSSYLDLNKVKLNSFADLDIDIIPNYTEKSMNVVWLIDGFVAHQDKIAFKNLEKDGNGSLVLGDIDNGFDSVIDEFGIYYKNNDELYSNYKENYITKMKSLYKGSLLVVDGFDFERKDLYQTNGSLSNSSLIVEDLIQTNLFNLSKQKSILGFALKYNKKVTGLLSVDIQNSKGVNVNNIKLNFTSKFISVGANKKNATFKNGIVKIIFNVTSGVYSVNINGVDFDLGLSNLDDYKFKVSFDSIDGGYNLSSWIYATNENVIFEPYIKTDAILF